MKYPETKREFQAWLERIDAEVQKQGQIVDARLLDKRKQVEKIIAEIAEREAAR